MNAAPTRRRVRLTADARRAQLIDEATVLIAQNGYHKFSIAALARASRISRQGVLHHYPSREAVLVAVLRRRDEQDSSAVGRPGSEPSRALAQQILHDIVTRNAAQREIVRLYTVLSSEALDPSHPAHAYFLERYSASMTLLHGLLSPWHPSPDAVALQILSAMDGLQLNWLRTPTIDLVAEWDGFVAKII